MWVRVRVRFAFCSFGFSFTGYIRVRVRVRVMVRVRVSVTDSVRVTHPYSSRNMNHMLANMNLFACECEFFLSLVTFACFGSHLHASV